MTGVLKYQNDDKKMEQIDMRSLDKNLQRRDPIFTYFITQYRLNMPVLSNKNKQKEKLG
jgi:aspartokinase-like uncharacterized kinase